MYDEYEDNEALDKAILEAHRAFADHVSSIKPVRHVVKDGVEIRTVSEEEILGKELLEEIGGDNRKFSEELAKRIVEIGDNIRVMGPAGWEIEEYIREGNIWKASQYNIPDVNALERYGFNLDAAYEIGCYADSVRSKEEAAECLSYL